MTRPTRQQVDALCKAVDACKGGDWLAICHGRTLAAEVRALRQGLDDECSRNSDDEFDLATEVGELKAIIGRVEAEMSLAREAGFDAVDLRDLEAALKGKP